MYITCYKAHPSKLTITSIWKSPDKFRSHIMIYYGHGKIQKKSERDSSFTFVLLLTTVTQFLTPNAYGDV